MEHTSYAGQKFPPPTPWMLAKCLRTMLHQADKRIRAFAQIAALVGIFFAPIRGFAATRYVNINSPTPVSPYTSWATASRTIQGAVDVAQSGDIVLVTNGTYSMGGKAVGPPFTTNRVAITLPIRVISVNGPALTTIQGFQDNVSVDGRNSFRCSYVATGATLDGFTLANGGTRLNDSGGGVFCQSINSVVTNCVIVGNSARNSGGGVAGGTLYNCLVSSNSAPLFNGGGASASTLNNCVVCFNTASFGGGLFSCTLNNSAVYSNTAYYRGGGANGGTLKNCTVLANLARDSGGGVFGTTLINCIVYYNTAFVAGANYATGSSISYTCASPLPPGTGNIGLEPGLASLWHLAANSPCLGQGNPAAISGVDLDGDPWRNPPAIGCDEYVSGSATGSLALQFFATYTNVAVGFPVDLIADIQGKVSSIQWDFGDGTIQSNRPFASYTWTLPGIYTVTLTAFNDDTPTGLSVSKQVRVVAPQPLHYVSASGTNPVPPYYSWETAATNIQDAIDVAQLGDTVLVTNGVYAAGGRAVYGLMTNRVAVTRPILLTSVNGASFTIVEGYQVAGTTNGDGAIRCVYLTNGASLVGFTLRYGATRQSADPLQREQSGGGVWCPQTNSFITNCVMTLNSAYSEGGGARLGKFFNCAFSNNTSYGNGGGAGSAVLNRCTLDHNWTASAGGGAYSGSLNDCELTDNTAISSAGGAGSAVLTRCKLLRNRANLGGGTGGCYCFGSTFSGNQAAQGGGAYAGNLYNCVFAGNRASAFGGAVDQATVINCTLTGNSALTYGGGATGSTLDKCVVYYNISIGSESNYSFDSDLTYCCTTPMTLGFGNITNEPALSSPSHLSVASPCRGAGRPGGSQEVDIDGQQWANPPDIGCDEFSPLGCDGPLAVSFSMPYTNVAAAFALDFVADIQGCTTASLWDFGDGTVVSNRPYAKHAWSAPGDYTVTLIAFNSGQTTGTSMVVRVQERPIHYVVPANPLASAPYSSWDTAATNIQDAVDAASLPGALVVVTNGTYGTGARVIPGDRTTNRVVVTKPLRLQSVNGPGATIIQGYQLPTFVNGPGAIRCVYLGSNAVLSGFTLTNGATDGEQGGGVRCLSSLSYVTNCYIFGCSANSDGGACCAGIIDNCLISNNSSPSGGGAAGAFMNSCNISSNSAIRFNGSSYEGAGGGASRCYLRNCLVVSNIATSAGGLARSGAEDSILRDNFSFYGGGAQDSFLLRCQLLHNTAVRTNGLPPSYGGGASSTKMQNCILSGNFSVQGGGAYNCGLWNCTICSNSASDSGGGVYQGTMLNCIAYYNTAPNSGSNYDATYYYYCCTAPFVDSFYLGPMITNPPAFVSFSNEDFHLSPDSPCINSGHNDYVFTKADLDGNLRITGGTVDIGAYEYSTPTSVLPYYWLQQFGLPTDGSADYADSDGDGLNNWQEWRAHTSPIDPASVLKIIAVVPTNNPPGALSITWQSSDVIYSLQRSTNISSAFFTTQSNIVGQAGTTTIIDATAANASPLFYRVLVQY